MKDDSATPRTTIYRKSANVLAEADRFLAKRLLSWEEYARQEAEIDKKLAQAPENKRPKVPENV